MKQRQIARVFDFDDTLAMSKGFIRVLHYENGDIADTAKWMKSLGFEGKNGPLGSIEITTDDYAKYASKASSLVKLGKLLIQNPGQEIKSAPTDVVDYSGVARILAPKPIMHVVNIAKDSFSRGEIIGIITGRNGGSGVYDVTGKFIKTNNRSGIQKFLRKHGLVIDSEDIHCVGDMPGGVPHNKAEVMKIHFIEKYDPETVIFYDDDHRNLSSVAAVDRRIHCIDANEISNGWGTVKDIIEAGSKRRKGISSWGTALQRSGVK